MQNLFNEQSTVFVVDDDRDFREALKGLLQSVGLSSKAFASTDEFLQARQPEGPRCLILDVRLKADSGLHFFTELREAERNIPVVFITGHGDIPMAVQAIKDGAVDFLSKPFREEDLLNAVREALDRNKARLDAEKRLLDLRARYDSLSAREQRVMNLACVGLMNKQIAAELDVCELTVKVDRHKLMEKLGAKSLPELVRMAGRLQIPSPQQRNRAKRGLQR
jgi:FixJ family two-component response regulator